MRIFNKNNKNGNIVILKQTKPNTCGGTDATIDTSAPKEIKSENMIFFDISSRVGYGDGYIKDFHAFAAKGDDGNFIYLETIKYIDNERNCSWALISDDIFSELNRLVLKYDIAKQNGYHSTTHGLPENFGGSVDIRYSSEERISISDNQSPVISGDACYEIVVIFNEYLNRERVDLPDISTLQKIRFLSTGKDSCVDATLTLNAEGTGTNKKTSNYGDDVFQSEKTVDKDTISAIKSAIENTGLLAWNNLPKNKLNSEDKTLTFIFEDGEEITVHYGVLAPSFISNGFFSIELELKTKN